MSVVICVIDRAQDLYLAADRRAVQFGVKRDDYSKIYEIRPKLYVGITGLAELGDVVVQDAKKQSELSVSELIEHLDSRVQPSPTRLTVTLAGRDDQGGLFVWQKTNEGKTLKPEVRPEEVVTSTASTGKNGAIHAKLISELRKREGIEKAIRKTVEYASTIEHSISPSFELVKVVAGRNVKDSVT